MEHKNQTDHPTDSAEHTLMSALLRVIYERRRLWPPDNSSFVACVGLLGWLPFAYVPPSQAVEKLMDWMWLSGLHEIQPRHRDSAGAFRVGDQLAIDAYAIGVTEGVFSINRFISVQWLNKPGVSAWEMDELISLQTLGRRHGALLGSVVVENGRAIRGRLEGVGLIEQVRNGHVGPSCDGVELSGAVGGGQVFRGKAPNGVFSANQRKKAGWKTKSDFQKNAKVRRTTSHDMVLTGGGDELARE